MTIRPQQGLTLVELMIGLIIGLLVVGIVSALFLNTTRSYRQDERVSALNDELRFMLGEWVRDVEMTGFFGTMIDPTLVRSDLADGTSTLVNINDCGVGNFLQFAVPVDGINQATAAEISQLFPCITVGEVSEGVNGSGSGAIRLNRFSGSWISRAELDAGRRGLFLQTLSDAGGIAVANQGGYVGPLDAACASAVDDPCRYWDSRSSIYYIRNFTSAGDQTPCLTRKRLQPSGSLVIPVSECIVSGVEDFHVGYGISEDGAGIPVYYTTNPTEVELSNVVALQIHVLIRSIEPDGGYRNRKTFILGDKVIMPGEDRFYRRVGSLTVPLRNIQAQRVFQ